MALVPRATTAEPEESDAMGTFRTACRSVDPECCDPAPASCHALQRQVSAVRAVCSNPARTDLCGGRGVNSRPYRDCGRGERVTAAPTPILPTTRPQPVGRAGSTTNCTPTHVASPTSNLRLQPSQS